MNNKEVSKKIKTKDIVFCILNGIAMLIISGVTVPVVLGVPFPSIRTLVTAPFFGFFITLALIRVKGFGTCSFVSFVTSIPMIFISPVIPLFTIGAGVCADIYFAMSKKSIKRISLFMNSFIYMFSMAILGNLTSIFILRDLTFAGLMTHPLNMIIGIGGSGVLGGVGAFLATRVSKEFRLGNVK